MAEDNGGSSQPCEFDHAHPQHPCGRPDAYLLVPVHVRPSLSFVPVDDEASWVISRTVVDGRYRWRAKLHLDGVRRSERAEALAEHGRKLAF